MTIPTQRQRCKANQKRDIQARGKVCLECSGYGDGRRWFNRGHPVVLPGHPEHGIFVELLNKGFVVDASLLAGIGMILQKDGLGLFPCIKMRQYSKMGMLVEVRQGLCEVQMTGGSRGCDSLPWTRLKHPTTQPVRCYMIVSTCDFWRETSDAYAAYLSLIAMDQHRVIATVEDNLECPRHLACTDPDDSLVCRYVNLEMLDTVLLHEGLVFRRDGLGHECARRN